ncbi:Type IV conjugative transfer system protein TraE [Candidatus Megaera venefica]|jgi:type IV conjugative transfer system protein TraE|uniref:Type IV conjugative transfer system protein TraE n=1 Tax=Candidatus Megaera venefica TaxID=2055910 RepID=A0ABU5NC26_9RICK|nr:TraE/TraK family type IV conjugative transfer system protein [Candidatus Megaera venefica]MEA0970699.1 Type IV conjugative transfer system protein TraE [Candidatus Megaera venefica]
MEVNTEDRLQNTSIMRQRNFFAGCTLLAVIANFLLVVKISSTTERIIMVPGITKDLAVEGSVVSQSYLEETALLFVSALLDLTADTISLKKNIILKHASAGSEQSLKSLQSYFADKEDEHKKFGLSTFFAPKQMQVDSKNLQVVIEGVLTSTFGKRGFEQNTLKYLLSFDYVGGHLKLKEFTQVKPKTKEGNDQNKEEEQNKST